MENRFYLAKNNFIPLGREREFFHPRKAFSPFYPEKEENQDQQYHYY